MLRLCSWSRRTTKSASEALLEVVSNVLDACVGRVALRANLMLRTLSRLKAKKEIESLIGLRVVDSSQKAEFEGIISH